MMQFAAGAAVMKELVGALAGAVEDPNTYKRIEGIRQFLCKLTGREIDQNGLVALLEGVTQGDRYTGKWEKIDNHSRRLRVDSGWIYDVQREGSHPIFVPDP